MEVLANLLFGDAHYGICRSLQAPPFVGSVTLFCNFCFVLLVFLLFKEKKKLCACFLAYIFFIGKQFSVFFSDLTFLKRSHSPFRCIGVHSPNLGSIFWKFYSVYTFFLYFASKNAVALKLHGSKDLSKRPPLKCIFLQNKSASFFL